MSDRSYFSLRYAVPGYSFLFTLFMINIFPFYSSIIGRGIELTFSASLGILSLFGGSAIGFLISQVWWYIFQRRGAIFSDFLDRNKARPPVQRLMEKYHLINPKNVENTQQQRQRVVNVYGYIKHSELERGMEKIVNYTTRRWDMHHVLSSTRISLIIGTILGIIIRFIIATFPETTKILLNGYEFLFIIIIALIVRFLIYTIERGLLWINIQYDGISKAIIENSRISEEHLRKIFPQNDYFEQPYEVGSRHLR